MAFDNKRAEFVNLPLGFLEKVKLELQGKGSSA